MPPSSITAVQRHPQACLSRRVLGRGDFAHAIAVLQETQHARRTDHDARAGLHALGDCDVGVVGDVRLDGLLVDTPVLHDEHAGLRRLVALLGLLVAHCLHRHRQPPGSRRQRGFRSPRGSSCRYGTAARRKRRGGSSPDSSCPAPAPGAARPPRSRPRPPTTCPEKAAGTIFADCPGTTRATSVSFTFTSAYRFEVSAMVIRSEPAMLVALGTAVSPTLMVSCVTRPSMGARSSVLASCSRACFSCASVCSDICCELLSSHLGLLALVRMSSKVFGIDHARLRATSGSACNLVSSSLGVQRAAARWRASTARGWPRADRPGPAPWPGRAAAAARPASRGRLPSRTGTSRAPSPPRPCGSRSGRSGCRRPGWWA